MRLRRLRSALALLLVVLTLGGCAGEDDADDTVEAPLTTTPAPPDTAPARHRAQCVVSDPQGEIILHPGSLTPSDPMVLGSVALEAPVNLEVIESDVVRFTGRSTIQGIVTDYPPLKNAGLADSLADWEQRRPLADLALGPDDGQQAVLVAVRLLDPTRPGHLSGVILTGDGGDTTYAQPVLIKPSGASCTVADYDATLDWVP